MANVPGLTKIGQVLESLREKILAPKIGDRVCEQKQLFEGRDQANTGVLMLFDTNRDAAVDVALFIPDDELKSAQAHLDRNFDGNTDIIVEDRDGNAKWDISFHDVDLNGSIDLVGHHLDGQLGALTPRLVGKFVADVPVIGKSGVDLRRAGLPMMPLDNRESLDVPLV